MSGPEGGWQHASPNPPIGPREVHVWRLCLDQPQTPTESLARSLSTDELSRADSFVHERDGSRFVVGRCALRHILAGYLNRGPGEIAFRYGPHGKPELGGPAREHGLQFNTSHSNAIALVAVATDRRVGIDVEHLRAVPDALDIAHRFFAPAEAAALRAVSVDGRRLAFFRCWTRKEAYVKALGMGLALPLDAFEVSASAEPAALRSVEGQSESATRWSLLDLDVADSYVAALAFEGRDATVTRWQLKRPQAEA